MAHLFSDGFDVYAVVADVTQRWDAASNMLGIVSAANTAFGAGQGFAFTLTGGATASLTKSFTADGTVFISIRLRRPTSATSASQYLAIALLDTATAQVALRFNDDGSISAHTGAATGTTLATAASVTTAGVWDSYQIKFVIGATGSIEVRKNGSASPITFSVSLSGVNTRGGGAVNTVNKVSLQTSATAASNWWMDDFFLHSGSGAEPTDWIGDPRCWTAMPSVTISEDFTNAAAAVLAQAGSATTLAATANVMHFTRVVAPFSGTLSAITVNFALGITGNVNAFLYSDNGTNLLPLAKLAQGTQVTNPVAGLLAIPMETPPEVVKGTAYWVGVWSSATLASALRGSTAVPIYAYTSTYNATVPESIGVGTYTASGTGANLSGAIGSIPTFQVVGNTTLDGDTSAISSATVDAQNMFGFPALLTTPTAIIGVAPFMSAKKSDAGAKTVALRALSGATEVDAVSTTTLGGSYTIVSGFLGLDPDTSAAWTKEGVDAMTLGPKVVA